MSQSKVVSWLEWNQALNYKTSSWYCRWVHVCISNYLVNCTWVSSRKKTQFQHTKNNRTEKTKPAHRLVWRTQQGKIILPHGKCASVCCCCQVWKKCMWVYLPPAKMVFWHFTNKAEQQENDSVRTLTYSTCSQYWEFQLSFRQVRVTVISQKLTINTHVHTNARTLLL